LGVMLATSEMREGKKGKEKGSEGGQRYNGVHWGEGKMIIMSQGRGEGAKKGGRGG